MSHQHEHARERPPEKRPITGLTPEDLQPAGNAAAQQDMPRGRNGGLFGPVLDLLDRAADGIRGWLNDAESESWWEEYKRSGESHRQGMAHTAWREQSLQGKINALSTEQQVDQSLYRDELGEVLDYLQQFEMMRAAGQTWEQMATSQATHMVDEARRRVQEQNPGGPPPTDAELQAAHEEGVADQTYLGPEDTSWWDGLAPAEQATWKARGEAAVRAFVAFAAWAHPELNVQESEIGVDIPGNSNSVAYVSSGKCWIGKITIEAIELNPAYATSTIMHELRGHPEIDTGFSLGMELYDAAAPQMPGYVAPAPGSEARVDEWRRFEYFESEIGALMREASFWVASQDLDGNGTIEASEENPLGAPDALLDDLLRNLAEQFAPSLRAPFVIGLARRFEADPRVQGGASAMFASACQRILGVTV